MASKLGFRFGVFAACSVALVLGGCTAILGSFDVTPGGPDAASSSGGAETGSDSPISTGEGGADGAVDGGSDASPLLLQCGVQNIRTVEEISAANDSFDPFLFVFRIANNGQVRIIARHRPTVAGGAVPTGFNAYTFDPKAPATTPPVIFQGPTDARVIDVRRQGQQNQIGVLAFEPTAVNPTASTVTVLQLPDANLTTATRYDVSKPFTTPAPNASITGALGISPTSGNDYFYAYALGNDQQTSTTVFTARSTPTAAGEFPNPTAIATAGTKLAVSDLVQTSQGVFVFDDRGPEPGKQTVSTGYWKAPATGDLGGLISQPISMGQNGMALLAANSTGAGGLRLIAGQLDFTGAGSPAQMRFGDLNPPAQIEPIEAANLPVVFAATSLLDVPFGGRARSINDEIVWAGTPTTPQEGIGLNFIWYGIDQQALRATNVNAARLIPARTNIIASSITFATTPTNISGDFDLVWIEAGAAKKTLFYGDLSCVK